MRLVSEGGEIMLRWALIWVYGDCCCCGRDRKIPVLPVPGDLPRLFYYGHIGRQKSSIGRSHNFDGAVEAHWAEGREPRGDAAVFALQRRRL